MTWSRNEIAAGGDVLRTGIEFLDDLLGESARSPCVGGLLGPIGVGKSTLAAMMAVEGAKLVRATPHDAERPPAWVFFNFDGSVVDIQERLYSHGAQISRNESDRQHWSLQLSSTISYRRYEDERHAELPRDENDVLMGETERLRAFCRFMERHIVLMHMPSLNHNVRPGEAIAAILERDVAPSRDIAGVVIDYAGAAMRDYVRGREKTTSLELIRLISNCRRLIAQQHRCPVWIVHQLNGTANTRAPGVMQHHEDARDCRYFGDNLDVCFVLGTRDFSTHRFTLRCTKTPSEPESIDPVILEFDSCFATLRRSQTHQIDRVTQRIVPVSPSRRVHLSSSAEQAIARMLDEDGAGRQPR